MKNLWNRLFGGKRKPEPAEAATLTGKEKENFLHLFIVDELLKYTGKSVRVRNNEAHVECPYHASGTTPTLSVALSMGVGRKQGMFYCFACNEHGNWNKLAQKAGLTPLPVEPDDPPELTPVFQGSLGRQYNRGQHVSRAHRPGHKPAAQVHYFDVQDPAAWDRSSPSRQDNSSSTLANIALMGAVISSDSDTRRESCAAPHAPSTPAYEEPTRSYAPDPTPSTTYDSPSSTDSGSPGGCD